MSDSPNVPPAAPNPPGASGPTPGPSSANYIVTRQIYTTHFELRSPTGESYFDGGARKLVKADSEPLAQFLADVQFVRGEGSQKKEVRASYYFGEVPVSQWRPLQFITQGMLDAFETAAVEFYKKAHVIEKRPEFHKSAIRGFRLPDPDLEPDCYWLVGERFDARLVVLWGCEKLDSNKTPVPSLPIVTDPELFPNNPKTVVDKLRARVMGWEAILSENLALITEKKEPLHRFLARPIYDPQHVNVVGFKPLLAAEAAPIAKFKPMKKIGASEIQAFEKAARSYYEKAHEDPDSRQANPGVSFYERELRRNFRLPDVAAASHARPASPAGEEDFTELMGADKSRPKDAGSAARKAKAPRVSYWVYGKQLSPRLMIVVEGNEPQDKCLYLCKDPDLDIPPGAKTGTGAQPSQLDVMGTAKPQTVVDKLWLCRINRGKQMAVATAAVAVCALAYLTYLWMQPKHMYVLSAAVSNDPQFDPDNDRNVIEITFNNRPADTAPKSALPGAPLGQFSLRLVSKGATVPLKPPVRHKNDPKRVVLVAPSVEFEDHTTNYSIKIENAVDSRGNRLEATNIAVTFDDHRIPGLNGDFEPAAEDSTDELKVGFNEPLNKAAAETNQNYSLTGPNGEVIDVVKADLFKDRKAVVLKAAKPFSSKASYTLTIRNIADASRARNLMPETVTNFVFEPVPLRLRAVTADESQIRIKVEFNKLYDVDSANHAFKLPDSLRIGSVNRLDTKALEIVLTNSCLMATGQYTLQITKLKEGGTTFPTELTTNATFSFTGAPDTTAPLVGDLSCGADFLLVTFSKDLREASARMNDNYSVAFRSMDKWENLPVRFNASTTGARTVRLGYVGSLPNGTLRLQYKGVQDLMGNTADGNWEFRTGISYPITFAKLPVLLNGGTAIQIILWGSIDPSCERPENFSLSTVDGSPIPGVDITGVRMTPGVNTTPVQLNLSRKLELPTFKILFSNLKLKGEARLQNNSTTYGSQQ